MAPYFANLSCDPFTPRSSRCIIGTYVQYAVNATSAAEYKATLKFAQNHNIRVVIRNTGHDFLGKSTGYGALAIWTHNIKSVKTLDYTSRYYTGKAIKVGAGTQFFEVYSAAKNAGLVVVGGSCPSVGIAGGYTQGAGHGLLVSRYGFSADQTLAWEVVLANGSVVIATPDQNPDLYWALGGGGGGTYGGVLSLTIKAYPDQPTSAANLTFSASGISRQLFFSGVEQYLKGLPAVLDAGASSIWAISNGTFVLSPSAGIGMTKQRIDAIHEPVLAGLERLGIEYAYYSASFPTFLDMLNTMNAGYDTARYQIGSRLIPREVISANTSGLVQAIDKIESYGTLLLGASFNGSRTPSSPNALNEAYRKAVMSLSIGTLYNALDNNVNIANKALMTDTLVPALANLIPGGGNAYINEGDPFEPRFQRVFYGENYNRLLEIKRKYDPDNVFWARTAVGSEYWTERSDGRLCRSQGSPRCH